MKTKYLINQHKALKTERVETQISLHSINLDQFLQLIKFRLLLNISNEQNLPYGHTIHVHCSSDGY